MRCVVGNCLQPDDGVERCYWAKDMLGVPLEDHAYLDICRYHQMVFCTQKRFIEFQGWDRLDD